MLSMRRVHHDTGSEHPLTQLISQQHKNAVAKTIADLVDEEEEAALEGIRLALSGLSADKRRAVMEKLSL